jgi:tetratricopeptide (TPR) repeat protein
LLRGTGRVGWFSMPDEFRGQGLFTRLLLDACLAAVVAIRERTPIIIPVPKPPSFPSVSHQQQHARAQVLEHAAAALRMRRFAEAEQLAAEVLRASRADTAAASILARALIGQNRHGEAIAPLVRAARRGGDASIETLLGAALGGAGRREEAIEQLRRTTARRPPFTPAFQELAGQLAKTGRVDEAIAVVESGLALAPETVEMQLDLARLHLYRNERGKARAILLRAREAAPGRPEILTALARVLLLDGEYASAADAYRHALAHRPDDVMTRADLGACLLEMGERDAGEASLRSALRGGPQMFGRTAYALSASSHGRFFFRPSAVAKFLQGEPV